jgi:hypothetical protein
MSSLPWRYGRDFLEERSCTLLSGVGEGLKGSSGIVEPGQRTRTVRVANTGAVWGSAQTFRFNVMLTEQFAAIGLCPRLLRTHADLFWSYFLSQGYSSDRTNLGNEQTGSSRKCALSEVRRRVPVLVLDRGRLLGLPRLAEVTGRVRVLAMHTRDAGLLTGGPSPMVATSALSAVVELR